MALHPENWSVIIVGRWNRNILTPQRVWKSVFDKDDADQMEVLIPMDGISPYMLKGPYKDILFVVEGGRIRIQVESPSLVSLGRAMAAGTKALHWLPETPVIAAGFNINFRAGEPKTDIAQYLDSRSGAQLSEIGEITAGYIERSLRFKEGALNIKFASETDNYFLNCNFNRNSEDTHQLEQWLSMDITEINQVIHTILEKLNLHLEMEME